MSRRMLRNAGRKLSLAGHIGILALAFSLQSAAAVGVLDVKKVIAAPGTPSDADKKVITSYLDPFFKSFIKPADGATVPNLRKEYASIVGGIGKTPGHDFLNETAYRYASVLVADPKKQFSQAARYNAMLLLADLNESDVRGATKPYMKSLAVLGKTLSAPDSETDYLKVAALIGVTRLAEDRALPPNTVAPLTGILIKLLAQTDPPAGRSDSAHNFMRRSAARALAALGSPGPNNQVVTEMRSILVDPNSKTTLRCEIAQLFYQLNIPPESKIDLQDLANLIGWQTVEICEQELVRAEEEKREPSRRILLYALKTADVGLTGLNRSADKVPEAAGFISKIRSKVTGLYNQLDDVAKTPDASIKEVTTKELDEIRGLLKPKPAPEVKPTNTPAATATATAAKPAQ